MPNCSVAGCSNHNKSVKKGEVLFHRFPRDPELRKSWVIKCGRKDTFNVENARICSKHFTEKDYARDLKSELLGLPPKQILNHGAMPTIDLPFNKPIVITSYGSVEYVNTNLSRNDNNKTFTSSRTERKRARDIRKRALATLDRLSPKKVQLDKSIETDSHQFTLDDAANPDDVKNSDDVSKPIVISAYGSVFCVDTNLCPDDNTEICTSSRTERQQACEVRPKESQLDKSVETDSHQLTSDDDKNSDDVSKPIVISAYGSVFCVDTNLSPDDNNETCTSIKTERPEMPEVQKGALVTLDNLSPKNAQLDKSVKTNNHQLFTSDDVKKMQREIKCLKQHVLRLKLSCIKLKMENSSLTSELAATKQKLNQFLETTDQANSK